MLVMYERGVPMIFKRFCAPVKRHVKWWLTSVSDAGKVDWKSKIISYLQGKIKNMIEKQKKMYKSCNDSKPASRFEMAASSNYTS